MLNAVRQGSEGLKAGALGIEEGAQLPASLLCGVSVEEPIAASRSPNEAVDDRWVVVAACDQDDEVRT